MYREVFETIFFLSTSSEQQSARASCLNMEASAAVGEYVSHTAPSNRQRKRCHISAILQCRNIFFFSADLLYEIYSILFNPLLFKCSKASWRRHKKRGNKKKTREGPLPKSSLLLLDSPLISTRLIRYGQTIVPDGERVSSEKREIEQNKTTSIESLNTKAFKLWVGSKLEDN